MGTVDKHRRQMDNLQQSQINITHSKGSYRLALAIFLFFIAIVEMFSFGTGLLDLNMIQTFVLGHILLVPLVSIFICKLAQNKGVFLKAYDSFIAGVMTLIIEWILISLLTRNTFNSSDWLYFYGIPFLHTIGASCISAFTIFFVREDS